MEKFNYFYDTTVVPFLGKYGSLVAFLIALVLGFVTGSVLMIAVFYLSWIGGMLHGTATLLNNKG